MINRRPRRVPATPPPKVVRERSGPLHAEVVSVGREILRGRIRDENGSFVAAELSRRGALVHRVTIVDDTERAIASAVSEALTRKAALVVTTGGLGPTEDDRTLQGVSEALRLPLTFHPPARDMVEGAYARLRGTKEIERLGLDAAREKMCRLPVGGEAIENPVGIAPGVLLRMTGGGSVLCLPGVPEECRAVFETAAVLLKGSFPQGNAAKREIETPTKDESKLRPWLDVVAREYPGVWVKTHPQGFGKKKGTVVVTIETFASSKKEADLLVDGALRRLLSLAGGSR